MKKFNYRSSTKNKKSLKYGGYASITTIILVNMKKESGNDFGHSPFLFKLQVYSALYLLAPLHSSCPRPIHCFPEHIHESAILRWLFQCCAG